MLKDRSLGFIVWRMISNPGSFGSVIERAPTLTGASLLYRIYVLMIDSSFIYFTMATSVFRR
jgi:hypothetical protein